MSILTRITAKNPDDALNKALLILAGNHIKTESRNGPVLRFPGLAVTEWTTPTNRISWSPIRDANPFLHYIEAFWMLAGRNDVALVSKLAANMANYSDDGTTLFGAYGWRWRNHFGQDQIAKIIEVLKADKTSRRCVLQMWDGAKELDQGAAGGKDLCCNTSISFDPCGDVLNMTVSNRSNDMVWGA
jgi:thymidylate synthase